jgi:hypothetical protein
MRRPHIRTSSVATIAAATALVVASGGTSAYAAHLITSKQIKNNTIKSIDVRDGTLTAADIAPGTIPAPYAGTSAFSTYHDAAVNIQSQVSGQDPTVLSLNLPAGSYVISGTTWLENNSASYTVITRCTLAAGGDTDLKRPTLEQVATGNATSAALALQVVHTFSSPGAATMRCYAFGVPVDAKDTKITATKVDHLTNTPG